MTKTAHLVALRVGLPQDHGRPGADDPMDRPWRTGFFKREVPGPVRLGQTGLDGDGQADRRHHGGPDKAVCVYPAARYPYWRQRLDRDIPLGSFGENFTIEGLDEADVCIGDIFRVGSARVEVSQPRSPCWKLARRWRERRLALWFQQTGYTGWYVRVLQEGEVQHGLQLELLERPSPEWTVLRANQVRYDPDRDPGQAAALARCDALGQSWRDKLLRAARSELDLDESRRLIGQNRER